MKLNINGKELNIKFGYKPTLKERIISKIVRFGATDKENEVDRMEQVEDLLLFIPEILLVGLQVHHEEYRYNYDTKEGKEEQLEKVFNLVDEYASSGADLMDLFNALQDEMRTDSFLSSIFRKEEIARKAEDAVQPNPEVTQNENTEEN